MVPRRGGGFLGQRAERLETGGGNRGGLGVVGYTPSGLFNKVITLKMPQEFRLRKEIPSLKLRA